MKQRFCLAAAAALICLTAAGCGSSSSGSPETSAAAPEATGSGTDSADDSAVLTLEASGTMQQFGNDDTPFTDALLDTLQKRHFTAASEIYEQNELIGRCLIEVNGSNLHLKTERVPSKLYQDTPAFGVQDGEYLFIGAVSYSLKNGTWVKENWKSPYDAGSDPFASRLIGLFFRAGELERHDFAVTGRDEAADGSVTESFVINKNDVLSVTYDSSGKPLSGVYRVTEQRFTQFTEEVPELTAPQTAETVSTSETQGIAE